MGIDVKCTNVKLWKNEHETKNGGKFFTYSISISRKAKDGAYKHKGLKVLPKEALPEEIPNGATCDIDGFMTLEVYTGRDGEVVNPMLYANRIMFKDMDAPSRDEDFGDSIEQLDEDVPF